MTPVPPPDVACLKCRLIYNVGLTGEGGNRFYLSYSGSTPSGATLITLASDIANQWVADLQPLATSQYALQEVDVIDITTDTGASGTVAVSHGGSRAGTALPVQCTTNVEFDIARRYRGGKPRMFLPAGAESDLATQASWTPGFVGAVNVGVAAFFAGIEGLSIGTLGTLQHVNLSYYKGFHNITNSSGRERAVPTYRATALSDKVVGYSTKAVLGSQRRRRTSTTP